MGAVMRSRVTPGVGSTIAMRRPASQLNSDDLPTFGRPTIATIGSATTKTSEQMQKNLTQSRKEDKEGKKSHSISCLLLGLLCAFAALRDVLFTTECIRRPRR